MRLFVGSSPLKLSVASSLALALAAAIGMSAHAQTPPAKADPESAEERAQKTADRVFTWIRFHNEATTKKQNAAAAAAAATATNAATSPTNEKASAQAQGKPAPSGKAVANGSPREAERLAQAHRSSVQESANNGSAVTADAGAARGNAQAANPVAATAQAAAELSQTAPVTQLALAPTTARPSETATSTAAIAAAAADDEPVLKLIHRVEPQLPRRLMNDFNGGTVLLRFVVQPDGSVKQAEAMRSTSSRLSAVAVDAVSQWRFEPISRAREGRVEIGFRPPE